MDLQDNTHLAVEQFIDVEMNKILVFQVSQYKPDDISQADKRLPETI